MQLENHIETIMNSNLRYNHNDRIRQLQEYYDL